MKLESQVVSLELAKRLKALGVERDSHFRWSEHTTPETLWCINALQELDSPAHYPTYAAFTVAELFELMPMTYASVEQHSNEYRAGITNQGKSKEYGAGKTAAEALGLMLAYLIENGLYSTK